MENNTICGNGPVPSDAAGKNTPSEQWRSIRRSIDVSDSNVGRKKDMWDAVQEALKGTAIEEGYSSDLSDTKDGSFGFRDFRHNLSVFRMTQMIGGGNSIRNTNSDGEEEEVGIAKKDDNIGLQKDDYSISDCVDSDEEDDTVGFLALDDTIFQMRHNNSQRRRGIMRFTRLGLTDQGVLMRLAGAEAAKTWARSFYHLDPRWLILTFFNDLALEGVDNLKNTGGIVSCANKFQVPHILRSFARAGVFSVWRPTSNDAIRKMITGEGVGKGLDIKGKSALKGKYSGFVPFLQISKNEDKARVCKMTTYGRVRIFYPNQLYRDKAAGLLELLMKVMCQKSRDARHTIQLTEFNEATALDHAMQTSPTESLALNQMESIVRDFRHLTSTGPMEVDHQQFEKALVHKDQNEMSDPRIFKIDEYASSHKGVFGLDIPEKLFWEGYVVNNDVTREVGSEDDTGRPSMPEFQGMNLHTLRKVPQKNTLHLSSDPRPVLYHAGCVSKHEELSESSNPLCPLDLLMAYEESDNSHGRVTPVVSDFDCFLVGTRGVKFSEPLREQELSMLTKCIDEIEEILSTPQEGVDWTKRWLEVKKKQFRNDQTHQEIPQFGYADPMSYAIMTGAVDRLKESGAVRHGPECFNYGFPQELDDSFLVVSDTLPGNVSKDTRLCLIVK